METNALKLPFSSTYHGFIDGVGSFVWKNAGRKTGNHFFDTKLMTDVENVIIHHHVVPKKVQISPHVGKEASYLGKRTGKYVGMFKD